MHGGDFAVERFARAVKFLDSAAGVFGLEQRAFAVLHPLVKMVGARIEPNNGSDLRQNTPVFRDRDNAPASRDDESDASDQGFEDFCFDRAEMFLAVLPENRGDRLPCFLRNKGVGVDEGEAGERGQDASDA